MTMQIGCETLLDALLVAPLLSDEQERLSGSLPLRDGIRFIQGAMLGIALCTPVWLSSFWVIARHF
jgi:hypothetical protein